MLRLTDKIIDERANDKAFHQNVIEYSVICMYKNDGKNEKKCKY